MNQRASTASGRWLRVAALGFILAMTLAGCGQFFPQSSGISRSGGPLPGAPAVRADECNKWLRVAIAALPPNDRENVVLFSHGQICSNRGWLMAQSAYLTPTSNAHIFRDPDGNYFSVCDDADMQACEPSSASPAASPTAVSAAQTFYSAMGDDWDKAQVKVPCSESAVHRYQTEYTYLGGRTTASEADFGLAVISTKSGTGSPDALFVPDEIVGYTLVSGLENRPTRTKFYAPSCGKTDPLIDMEFFVTKASKDGAERIFLNVALQNLTAKGKRVTLMQGPYKPGAGGWNVPCTPCQVKRATTFAAPTPNPSGTPNPGATAAGGYFGMTDLCKKPLNQGPQPHIIWSHAQESKNGGKKNWIGKRIRPYICPPMRCGRGSCV